jgi:hypothetical protein
VAWGLKLAITFFFDPYNLQIVPNKVMNTTTIIITIPNISNIFNIHLRQAFYTSHQIQQLISPSLQVNSWHHCSQNRNVILSYTGLSSESYKYGTFVKAAHS